MNKTETMAEKIIQWSNINTGTFNILGLERLAKVLVEEFSILGGEGDILSLPPIEQIDSLGEIEKKDIGPLLRFWKRPNAPLQVLLVAHMDTVYGLEHAFQKATKKNAERVCGPGVTDMKGGICVMLEALKAFEKTPNANKLGWEVLITPDEEIGSLASGPYLAERAKFHQVGLVFEPAMDEQGTLASERKGSGHFTIVLHGRAAHAGRAFHEGKNAIVALSDVIKEIAALNGQHEGVTLNVGFVHGGGPVNVVPDFALCRLDVRLQKIEDEQWVQEQLESIIGQYQQREGYRVTLKGGIHRKPKFLTGKTKELYELVKKIGEELGQTITWTPSGGCCDGNNLAALGLPNVDSLGVCGGKIHSEEEYMLVNSLVPRVELTTAILTRLSENASTGIT